MLYLFTIFITLSYFLLFLVQIFRISLQSCFFLINKKEDNNSSNPYYVISSFLVQPRTNIQYSLRNRCSSRYKLKSLVQIILFRARLEHVTSTPINHMRVSFRSLSHHPQWYHMQKQNKYTYSNYEKACISRRKYTKDRGKRVTLMIRIKLKIS